ASGRAACEAFPVATAAHLRPEPRLDHGQLLAGLPGVRALMDVSDGLARDIPRLLGLLGLPGQGVGNSLGADLAIEASLLHPEARAYFLSLGLDPLEALVLGGEDYALLAGVQPAGQALVLAALPAARHIGTVSARPGLRLNGEPFAAQGFDHFALGEAAWPTGQTPMNAAPTNATLTNAAPINATLNNATLTILGHVRSSLTDRDGAPKSGEEGAPEAWLELDAAYAPALLGLEVGSRILVVTWLHQGDRSTLQCHPRADKARPLRGVFATRSPDRPNPLGLHEVTLLEIAHPARLRVFPLEAIDGTPVLDVKSLG
ncbi:MAG: TrmO family methyltransferase, partial [Humidesulfovibrio sp.]|nr:TrmO family methyltransferase [Humidesulfovibrio sp.]